MSQNKIGRYNALPMPEVKEVSMDQVPDPPTSSRDKYRPIWERVLTCEPGRAVCATFTAEKQAKAVRAKFRKLAKEFGRFLSSSHTSNGLTWYFWLEPRQVTSKK